MRMIVAAFTLLALVATAARAESNMPCTTAGENNAWLGIETIRLWPGEAPQASGKRCEDIPTLTLLAPARAPADAGAVGPAVVVVPGGAYTHLAANHEGRQVADWFTSRGFAAFILQYRLSSNGYLLPVPLLDARRAIQLVRARAKQYHIDPDRIVVVGFSAGGHLAALASVQPLAANPTAADPIERVSSRPNYLVLGYPWIGAISSDTSHLTYCKVANVMDRCEALRKAYSPDLFVTAQTPPTFWWHTFDDGTVPVEQGLRFYDALVKAGVPAEAHIFAHGPHGTGLGSADPALEQWPQLLEAWLREQGVLAGASSK
jgi:acetyl esterase/lipase